MPSRKAQPKAQGRGPWCPQCGRTVDRLQPSLDPRHPVGVCAYENQWREIVGHGRVPAVTDSDEIQNLLNGRDRSRDQLRHNKHLAAAPYPGCPVCARHLAHLAVTP